MTGKNRDQQGSGDDESISILRPLPSPGRRMGGDCFLRLATWNLHGGRGLDGVDDLRRMIRIIKDLKARVVALQDLGPLFLSGPGLSLQRLREETGLSPFPGRPWRGDGAPCGNLVLTDLAVTGINHLDLTQPACQPRGALVLDLEYPDGPLRVAATCLGAGAGERGRQVEMLLQEIPAEDGRVEVLLGDLREWLPGSPRLRRLAQRWEAGTGVAGYPSFMAALPLDRVLVHPAPALMRQGVHRGPWAKFASDHLPVWAEVTVREPLDPGETGRAAGAGA